MLFKRILRCVNRLMSALIDIWTTNETGTSSNRDRSRSIAGMELRLVDFSGLKEITLASLFT